MKFKVWIIFVLFLIGCASRYPIKKENLTYGPKTASVKIYNTNEPHFKYDFYVKIENEFGFKYENTVKYGDSLEITLETGLYKFCLEYKKKNAFWWTENCGFKTLHSKEYYLNAWDTYTGPKNQNVDNDPIDPIRMTLDALNILGPLF